MFVYSLDDLKLIGQVALPVLKLPGHEQIASVPNWVTFTPDGKTIYVSNAGAALGHRDRHGKTMKVNAVVPVGEVPKRINTMVIPSGAKPRLLPRPGGERRSVDPLHQVFGVGSSWRRIAGRRNGTRCRRLRGRAAAS